MRDLWDLGFSSCAALSYGVTPLAATPTMDDTTVSTMQLCMVQDVPGCRRQGFSLSIHYSPTLVSLGAMAPMIPMTPLDLPYCFFLSCSIQLII